MSSSLTLRSYHLTDRLKLTSIMELFPEKPVHISGTELTYQYSENQYLIIYNFGSIVFLNVDPPREAQIVTALQLHVAPKEAIVVREDFAVEVGENPMVDFKRVIVDSLTYAKIQTIALVLAQSTALDYYETVVEKMLEKSGRFTEMLEKEGRIRRRLAKEAVKFIGFCLNTKQKVITTTSLLDSPDPTWEDAQLETLYRQMIDMFEIRERFRTMEYKIKTIQETVEILSDLIDAQRTVYLEMTIIFLIAFEIIIYFINAR